MPKFRMPRPKPKVKVDNSVEIVEEKPPVYENVCAFLGYSEIQAYFTYGNKIYNPAKLPVPGDIIVHEKVHMKQQVANGLTPALWWGKYLRDEKFRIDQEARAYGAQLRALKQVFKDRNKQNEILHNLAMSLSGPLYGNVIDQGSAVLLIRVYSK